YLQSLRAALEGEPAKYECAPQALNKPGFARGELIGGNLTMLAHLLGTVSDVRTKNRLLFIEDTGEYLYNTDRMLWQLKRNGKLDRLAGLIVGGFTDTKDTPRPFGKSVYEIIHDHVKDFDYPVCYGFPVSHEKTNYALEVGGIYTLQVTAATTLLEQIIK
ncbi:MAG: LD-carboxypeptidase, partial [Chitinophagaceae bacterium]